MTQYRVNFIISATNTYSESKNWVLHLESSKTGSQNQRNPNAPTFEEGSIEWTFSMEEKHGKHIGFYTRARIKFQVRILKLDMGSSNQVPRGLFLHLLLQPRETRIQCGPPGASPHMVSKIDLTPRAHRTF